ncbi:MAG: GAF domain-containing protein [Alphaproteobacteria bacterium]|nr:GAF domain-containing protein [Alphaproteobacteria bacterium]MBU1277830.1 GAF domain-containing protein [Alphaproteobacteria bacterium]MBU1572104.1 GAF domain-containing protein [Alphaproteobacteria bacterium]MBU1830245.1 GAF domain-containing protein [Alphaproteobacteria bacterium]MBU2079797.1 GAF domain-containing protein [Alphaproteobacteria bacterium]
MRGNDQIALGFGQERGTLLGRRLNGVDGKWTSSVFDFADPKLMRFAQQLHDDIQPSGVVIFRARTGEAAPTLEVLANTNHPVGRKLDILLVPRLTIGHLVIEMNHELIIDDTLSHPLVKDSDAVTEMGIMAYIGVPYRLNGQAVGGVSVVHQHRRQWASEHIQAVRDVARQLDSIVADRYARGLVGEALPDIRMDSPLP